MPSVVEIRNIVLQDLTQYNCPFGRHDRYSPESNLKHIPLYRGWYTSLQQQNMAFSSWSRPWLMTQVWGKLCCFNQCLWGSWFLWITFGVGVLELFRIEEPNLISSFCKFSKDPHFSWKNQERTDSIINYHMIDFFDSLEPWLRMKRDSFIYFFQSLWARVFSELIYWFLQNHQSSVHIYQNLTHKDFLWNFEKEKITQLVPDITQQVSWARPTAIGKTMLCCIRLMVVKCTI